MLKDDGSSQGSAECSAFQKGLGSAAEKIVANMAQTWSPTFKFNLFRHYTEKNIYMIRKILNIGTIGRSDMLKFKVIIIFSPIQILISER